MCLGGSIAIGFLSSFVIRQPGTGSPDLEAKIAHKGVLKKHRFHLWKSLLGKSANFQAQIMLGFLFLVIFAPVCLIIRVFSDYLNAKGQERDTHWLEKTDKAPEMELYKKQS